DLPQRRVLQRPPLDLAGAARQHAALHDLEQDVALRRAAVALRHAVVVAAGQAVEASRRVLEPAHAADVGVEPRVAVGHEIEARALLVADHDRDRVGVLLTISRVRERIAEAPGLEGRDVPRRPRQRAGDRRRQDQILRRLVHSRHAKAAAPAAAQTSSSLLEPPETPSAPISSPFTMIGSPPSTGIAPASRSTSNPSPPRASRSWNILVGRLKSAAERAFCSAIT